MANICSLIVKWLRGFKTWWSNACQNIIILLSYKQNDVKSGDFQGGGAVHAKLTNVIKMVAETSD